VNQANSSRGGTTATRVPGWAYPAVTIASLLLGATNLVRGTSALTSVADSDLTNFFFRSAMYILNGNPWSMYAVRGATTATATYPNYNPPLSMFLMAPLLGLARAAGIPTGPVGADGQGPNGALVAFVAMPFIILIPLLGYIALWALRRLYPAMPETQRLLAFILVTLSPLAWQSISPWYHIEQPLMLCFLLAAVVALQRGRLALGGVLAGLAVLTRTTALVPLIALGVLLLSSRDWRGLLRFGGVGAIVAGLGFAPFFLLDPSDTMYSLVSWRGTAIIGGYSVWTIFSSTPLDSIARRLDFYAVILFVAIMAWLAARRFGVTAASREAWAVLAIATLAVPMLSKTNWPYYYLEPFILLLIWEFASMHDRRAGLWRWPVLSVGFLAVAGTLSQYIWLRSVGAGDRIAVGLLEFAVMLAFVIAVWSRMQAARPSAATDVSGRLAGVPGTASPGLAGAPRMPDAPNGYRAGRTPEVPSPPPSPQRAPWQEPGPAPSRTQDAGAENGPPRPWSP
jgi:hypothetical protein